MELTYEKITVEDSNSRRLFIFLRGCSEYFMLCENKSPTTKTLEEIITEVPEGYSEKDKLVMAIIKDGEIAGLMDILKGYPDKNTWMTGLLLISPEFRRLGYGRVIHKEIKRLAEIDGIETLRVGVVEENVSALMFWGSLGYNPLKKSKADLNGILKGVVIMTLDI